MTFGIDPSGFVPKPLQDIKDDLEAAFRATFGASIDLTPQSNFGQFIGIFSDRMADLWALGQAIYNNQTPDGAAGISLDNLAGLTGTLRLAATKTQVTITATGVPGTVLPIGRIVSINGSGFRFVTTAAATIGGGGTITVNAEAENTGVIPAYAGTVTIIETPVAGWVSVTNATDHSLIGTDLETDAALRNRREVELRAGGHATVEAIRNAVLDVVGVSYAALYENDTDAVNGLGMPAHSIMAVVRKAVTTTNLQITTALLNSKAAGIGTFGATGPIATPDTQGFNHDIFYQNAIENNVYVTLNLTVTPDFNSNAATNSLAVKQAIVDFANATFTVGHDTVREAIRAQAFTISGVKDVTQVFLGTAPSPAGTTNLVWNYANVGVLDTSRIVINLLVLPGAIP